MNVSFDDTSPYLAFSEQWRVQPPNQESSEPYWQNTYHAVQTKGASVRITFTGAGIYIYGSKGPGNAKYSVEIDEKVFYFDAGASSTTYQQLLYGDSMRNGAHSVLLTHEGVDAAMGGDGGWLDVDYIMVTTPLPDGVSEQSNPGSFPTTDGPPAASFAPSTSDAEPTARTASSVPIGGGDQTHDSDEPKTTLIAAIVLGALLGLVLVSVGGFFLYRRLGHNRTGNRAYLFGGDTGTSRTPPPAMHTRSVGTTSAAGHGPLSPVSRGPFDTPPGSQMAYAPTRSATSSPGPSVLQIGRSVAILDDQGMASFPRAHSSLSHHTAFSTGSFISPETGYAAQPGSRSGSIDALRETLGNSANRQSVLSNGSTVPAGIATVHGAPSSWLNQPPDARYNGKDWKSTGPNGPRQTRTWNANAGTPSIKTFVQVMDE